MESKTAAKAASIVAARVAVNAASEAHVHRTTIAPKMMIASTAFVVTHRARVFVNLAISQAKKGRALRSPKARKTLAFATIKRRAAQTAIAYSRMVNHAAPLGSV